MSDYAVLTVDMVNDLLRAFIMHVTGLPADYVLVETRNRPRPPDDKPYVTMYWKDQEMLPQFEGDFIVPEGEEDGQEYNENDAHCTVRITVRGKGAYNNASELRYALDSSERQFDLYNVIGFSGTSGVTDLSAVYGGQVQQRAFIELSFYACFGRLYQLAWFRTVPWIVNNSEYLFPRGDEPCLPIP